MRPSTSNRFEHIRSGAERAAESHTEYAARMLGSKPTQTLAGSMQMTQQSQGEGGAGAGAAGGKSNPFQPSSGPQSGKVISVSRSEVFGSTRTVLRVLMDRGGERTVNADANSGNVRVAMDVAEGDAVKLVSTGPQHWEWTKVVPVGEKVRKRRKVFDTDALLGPDGLQKIHDQFHLLKWETRPAYETKSLSQIVSMYKEWAFALWPKVSFPMLVSRVEKMGSNGAVKEALNDMRYGKDIDWDQYRAEEGEEGGVAAARKKARQAQLSANAAEIFDAYTAALQPGIRTAKPDGDSAVGAADEMDDDELNRLLDKYSGGGGNGAAAAASGATTAAAGKPTTAAALKASSAAAKKAAAASAEDDRVAAELERRYRESLDNDNDDVDLHARASNVWAAASSKAAAAAQSAAQEALDEAEAQALRASRPGKKRRAAVVDSDDEDEAQFAPLSTRNDSEPAEPAATEGGQAQPAEAGAGAEGKQDGAPVAAQGSAAEPTEGEGAAADVADATDSAAPVRTDTATQVLAAATDAEAMVVDAAAEPAAEPVAELAAEVDGAAAAADAEPVAAEPSQGEPAASQQDIADEVDEDALANFLDDDAPASQAAAPAPAAAAAESQEATQVQESTGAPMDTAAAAAPAAAPEGQPQASMDPTQVL